MLFPVVLRDCGLGAHMQSLGLEWRGERGMNYLRSCEALGDNSIVALGGDLMAACMFCLYV